MGLFDNGVKVGAAVAIGIGAVVLAPVILPAVSAVGRPVAKALIKGAMTMVHKGWESVAEAREALEDIVAEAKAEVIAESGAHGKN
jgi:serine acetyltransferase